VREARGFSEVLHHARLDVYSTVAKLSSLNKVDMQEQMDGFQASKLQEEKENASTLDQIERYQFGATSLLAHYLLFLRKHLRI
jgi:hypothetical protein